MPVSKSRLHLMEFLMLEGISKVIELQPPCHGYSCHHQLKLPRAPHNPALSTPGMLVATSVVRCASVMLQ